MNYVIEIGKHVALDENKIIAEIAAYRTSSALFGNKLLWANKSISPVTWWKAFCSDTELSNVAITILNFPPTSASVERSFSRQSYIHSKTRNRLTNDKVEKLVFVSHNLDVDNGNLKVRRLKHIAAPEGQKPILLHLEMKTLAMMSRSLWILKLMWKNLLKMNLGSQKAL